MTQVNPQLFIRMNSHLNQRTDLFSSQLPPITLRHEYIAFRNLAMDEHLSKLSEPIPDLSGTGPTAEE